MIIIYGLQTLEVIEVEVFWVVISCSVVVGHQRFEGPCRFHLRGEAIS